MSPGRRHAGRLHHGRLRLPAAFGGPAVADVAPLPAPAVGIVLVTYYGTSNLEALAASLEALDYPPRRRFLVAVENDPEQRAARWFAANTPDVAVLVPGGNTGYAGGNAIGMEHALRAGVDYVAVLTQDTRVDPRWLSELVAVAEGRPAAGAVQPKILRVDPAGRPLIHSWGNELHFLGIGYVGGDGLPDRPLGVRPIGYASGAGVLYRAAALREVGLFDPAFFMYHEDSDLSWRLRLAGWEVLLAPGAVMYHDWKLERGPAKFYFIERNRLINVLTHYRLRTLALLAPALALFEGLVLVYALAGGWLARRLAVYAFFLRPATWRYLRRKRRAVQSLRRVPDRAIARGLTGVIDPALVGGRPLRWVVNPVFSLYWALVRRLISW